MVLQRTIDNLRERPKEERRAVALGISIAVMLILLIGWGMFFIRTVQTTQILPAIEYDDASIQTAAGAASDYTGWVSSLPEETPEDSGPIELIQQNEDTIPQ